MRFKLLLSAIVILIVCATHESSAQTTRDVEPQRDTNELFRTYSSSKKKKKKNQKLQLKTYAETQEEFEKRMKTVAKERRKKNKKMRKPQYSDPTYFGHKKPPKIRPLGKRKMCKECGIVH